MSCEKHKGVLFENYCFACLVEERNELLKALNYYRAAAIQGRHVCPKPDFMPKRIRLNSYVRGWDCGALPGDYDAICNQYGAVSIMVDGEPFGLKLHEFHVLEWQENKEAS